MLERSEDENGQGTESVVLVDSWESITTTRTWRASRCRTARQGDHLCSVQERLGVAFSEWHARALGGQWAYVRGKRRYYRAGREHNRMWIRRMQGEGRQSGLAGGPGLVHVVAMVQGP